MTNIYLITNPYLTSDPSPTAFGNMYDVSGQISSASLSSALSGFAINYISGSTYIGSFNAISLTYTSNADSISISFDEAVYSQSAATITVPNVRLSDFGTAYFVLVLYKQVSLNGNNSYVKIRLNADPSQ